MSLESDLRAAIYKIACDFETLTAEMREHRCDTVNLLEDKPPAPPFVLGPKTMAKFALIGSNVEIIQMAALLIAEWLLAESANEAVHAWADRILRGDWGKK